MRTVSFDTGGPLSTSSLDTKILQLHNTFSAAVPSHCNSGVCVVAAAAVKALRLLAEEVQTLDTATCSLIGKLLNVALERRRYTGNRRPVSTTQQQQQTADPEQGNSNTQQKKREAPLGDLHQNTQHDSVQWSEEELLSFWGDVAQQQKKTDGTDCGPQFKQALADRGKGKAVKTVVPFSSVNESEATATDDAPAMRAQHRGSKDCTTEGVTEKTRPQELSEALWHRYLASSSSGEGGGDANGSALPDISSKMISGQPDSLRVIPTTPAQTEDRRTSAAATMLIEIEQHLVSLQELLHRLLTFALFARQIVDTLRGHYNSTLTEQAGVSIAACPLLAVDASSHPQVLPVGLSPTAAKPPSPAADVTLTDGIAVARTTASAKGITLAKAEEVLFATRSKESPEGVALAKAGKVSIVSGLVKAEKWEKEKEEEEEDESTNGDRKREAEEGQAAQEACEDTEEHCSVSIRCCKVRNTERSSIEASEITSTYCTKARHACAAERENTREQSHRKQNEQQQKKQSKLRSEKKTACGHHQERGKEQQPALVAEQQVQHEGHQGGVEPRILVQQQQTHWQSPQVPTIKHSTQHQQQTHCQSPQVPSEKLSTQQHHLQSPQLPFQKLFSQQQQQEQQKQKREETFCNQQELRATEVQKCDASKKQQQKQKPHHLQAVANKQEKRCNHLFNLLQLCEVVVNTIEADWRFKQEVKEELHFDAPLGVFRAAKAAWSAMPYVSDLAPLLQKAAAECSTGNQQQAAVLEGRDSYIYP